MFVSNFNKEGVISKQTIISLENDSLSLKFMPHLGAKLIELKKKGSSANYLHCNLNKIINSHPDLERTQYVPPYASGFDECFPSVTPSAWHIDGKNVRIPDHGFLWSSEWSYIIDKENHRVCLTYENVALGFLFVKHITLKHNMITIDYNVTNLSKNGFHYVWSSHPLLQIDEGDEIFFIPKLSELDVYWCSEKTLKKGDQVSWHDHELSPGNKLNVIPNSTTQKAIKLFTPKNTVHSLGLKKKSGSMITMSFNPTDIPYVGVWLCYGAWPDKVDGEYSIGLEPTSSNKDDLCEAIEHGTAPYLKPKCSDKWSIDIRLG